VTQAVEFYGISLGKDVEVAAPDTEADRADFQPS